MTKEERKSVRIAQKLTDALVEFELFTGDADIILNDVIIFTHSPRVCAKLSPGQARELRALIDHIQEYFAL